MGLLRIRDKELGLVRLRILARVGHGDNTAGIKLNNKYIGGSSQEPKCETVGEPTLSVDLISSWNGLPHTLCPPFPVPVGSPL